MRREEFILDKERVTLGRARENVISLNHYSISRFHCELRVLDDERYEVVDRGSSNGLLVNSVPFRFSVIQSGDTIQLGKIKLKLVVYDPTSYFADKLSQLSILIILVITKIVKRETLFLKIVFYLLFFSIIFIHLKYNLEFSDKFKKEFIHWFLDWWDTPSLNK